MTINRFEQYPDLRRSYYNVVQLDSSQCPRL